MPWGCLPPVSSIADHAVTPNCTATQAPQPNTGSLTDSIFE